MAYNPQKDGIVVSKPFGALGFNVDARSTYYDDITKTRRPFVSTAEVLSYFDTAFKREGNFTILVDDGSGVVKYWFKDGVADSDLVLENVGGSGGSTDWSDITNKPTFIAAGSTEANARAAIGAGTSNLTLGVTSTTAKAGDYTPSMSDVTGLNTALSNKVDKVAGKSLILDTEIIRLSTVTNQDISGKQDTLVSATNIKTINGVSVLGSGDLIVSGGGGGGAVLSVAGKTGVVTLDKNDVGLTNVDNTSDAAKEVLSATKLKTARKINGVDFDGTANITVTSPSNLALGTRTDITQPITNDNGSGFTLPVATTTLAGLLSGTLKTAYDAVVTWISTNGANVLSHLSSTSNPHSVTKSQVGLGNNDNTSDANKPVSTAQQTALNLKANLASPAFTGTVSGITASMVGAPSGSGTSTGTNTGDQTWTTLSGKPTFATVATTGAYADLSGTPSLAGYAPLASPTFTGTPSLPTGTTAITQTAGDNSTKLATTAYVKTAVDAIGGVTLLKGSTTVNGTDAYTTKYKDVTVVGASVGDRVVIQDLIKNNGGGQTYILHGRIIAADTLRIYIAQFSISNHVVPAQDPSSTAWTINYAVIK